MKVIYPSRRQVLGGIGACSVGLIGGVSLADNPSGSSTPWHKLSDRERGIRIVSAALAGNGGKGGECKEWVRKVISDVSGTHVTIPSNQSEPTHVWVADNTGHILSLGARITKAKPGDIVQMVTRFAARDGKQGEVTSHTAIVGANSGGSITWLESNYRVLNTVTVDRVQSHDAFLKSLVDGLYTVYRVT